MSGRILNPQKSLLARDLEILGPLLIQKLQEVFSFSSGAIFPAHAHEDGLPPVRLSERQRPRAREALSNGRPFWDRVSSQVLIPLDGASSASPGTLVLSGISRVVGPEESQRVLPLLKAVADQGLLLLKNQTIAPEAGRHPRYLLQWLDRLSDTMEPAALLHLLFRRSHSLDHVLPVVLEICAKAFPGRVPHLMGMGASELWIGISPGNGDHAFEGLKRIARLARKKKTGLLRAYMHVLPRGTGSQQALNRIRCLEKAAADLGINVMGTPELQKFEKRLGIDCLCEILEQVSQAVRRHGSVRKSVVFARPVHPASHDTGNGLQTVHIFQAGKDSAFFVLEGTGRPDEAIQTVCSMFPAEGDALLTMGAASSAEPTTRGTKSVRASLWAYIHASLLGQGSHVAFDALSWNVTGDEYMAWGDIAGAMDAYRKGLRIDRKDANLWNSLGVCLGQTGRKKEAEQAFIKAVELKADHYMALYNLAGVYEESGRNSEALDALQRAMDLCPGNLTIATRLSQFLFRSGRPQEVINLLVPLLADTGEAGIGAPLRILARAFRQTGDWPRAKAYLERALRLNPSDHKALALLAHGYWQEEGDEETGRHLAAKAMESGSMDKTTARLLEELYNRGKTGQFVPKRTIYKP